MRRRQKAALLLATVGLAAGVAACGSDDDQSTSSSASATTASTTQTADSAPEWLTEARATAEEAMQLPDTIPTADLGSFEPKQGELVYHVACNLAIEGCSKIANAIEDGVKGIGNRFEKCDGGTTADQINQCFTNAINAKPAAIVVNGIDAQVAGAGYDAAKKAGIPIVGTFTGNPEGVEGVVTEVAGDACAEQGRIIGDYVVAETEGKANVLWVGTKTFTCNQQRQQGFMDALAKCDTCEVDTLEFAVDAVQSRLPQQLQAELQSKPDLNFIVGTFDSAALAATDAIRQAGKADKIKVAGFDADAPNLELIRQGDIQVADITTGSVEPGWAAADAAARASAGEDVPAIYPTSIMLITKDNIDEIGETFVGATDFETQFKELWGSQ